MQKFRMAERLVEQGRRPVFSSTTHPVDYFGADQKRQVIAKAVALFGVHQQCLAVGALRSVGQPAPLIHLESLWRFSWKYDLRQFHFLNLPANDSDQFLGLREKFTGKLL